jgi:endo-1,4-beta-D-glucanase Y
LIGAISLNLAGCTFGQGRAAWFSAWKAYRQTFIDGQGRVIDYSADNGFTTSEGQAYALFLSLAAGDRDTFHRVLAWTNTNMAGGRLGQVLAAWKWGREGNSWAILGHNSATDADAWMAYTLLQAGRIWRDHNLGALGNALAASIVREETLALPGFARVLLPGAADFPHTSPLVINPSYTPLFLAHGIAQATGNADWKAIAAGQPKLIAAVARHGFAPDWTWLPALPRTPVVGMPQTGTGSYDAIRCYLWAGLTNPGTPGARDQLGRLGGMATYLENNAAPPVSVDIASGVAQGSGPVGFSGALLPYLARLHKTKLLRRQHARVLGSRTVSGLFGEPAEYYNENLILFGLGGLTGVIDFDPNGAVVGS